MRPILREYPALRRLRWPLISALAGIAFAAAWLIRGGPSWWISIVTLVMTAVRVIWVYRTGDTDTDEGALAGSRADERQRMVGLRCRALAGSTAIVASFIGLTVSVAARSAAGWPFLIMMLVTLFGYLFGLSAYGAGEPEPELADQTR
jgi:hypothetical protein